MIDNMETQAQTVLEWTYEPSTLFEEEVTLAHSGGVIRIDCGHIKGVFDATHYEQGREFRDCIHEIVSARVRAQEVQVRKQCKLSAASMSREYADGRRDVTAFPETLSVRVKVNIPDIIVKDAHGNVVKDSKTERLKKQKEFGENVSILLPQDIALKRMLESFHNALRDPDNALIHLYEIMDAVVVACGTSKDEARRRLILTEKEWSKFGRIANNAPLLEGRHRGKHEYLKKASKDESQFATKFAQRIIEQYVLQKLGKL